MSNVTQTFRGTASLEPSRDPVIYNLSAPTANTEVSQALSVNTKQIIFRSRAFGKLQFSFVATESGTKFITVPKGKSGVIDNINLSGKTLYIQSDKGSDTIEILEFS